MIQMTIDHWSLVEIAKHAPDVYEVLREQKPSLLSVEKTIAGEGCQNFEAWVNDISAVPNIILDRAKFQRPELLKIIPQEKEKSVSTLKLAEAMQAYQVYLPGNELLKIKQVVVRDDYCTELLQSDLEEGWSIIAVLPKTGQRRPDYVLGK